MIKARMRNPAIQEPTPEVSPPVPPATDLTTVVSRPKPHVSRPTQADFDRWDREPWEHPSGPPARDPNDPLGAYPYRNGYFQVARGYMFSTRVAALAWLKENPKGSLRNPYEEVVR